MQNGYGQFQPQRAVFPSTWFGRVSCVICSSIPRLSRVSCELGSTPGLGGAKVDEMNTLLEGLGAEPGQVQKQDGVPGVFYTFRKDIEEYKDIWSAPGRGETKPAWGEEEKYISVRSWDVRRGLSNASYQTVVQSQGAALADPQRRECRAYSGTGQSMRAQSGMHSGRGGLKLQEGRVRRGLVSRLERILCHGVSEGVLCHADILQQLQSRGWMQRLDAGRPAWAPRLWCSPSSETQPRHCFRKSSLPMAGARTCASWRCIFSYPTTLQGGIATWVCRWRNWGLEVSFWLVQKDPGDGQWTEIGTQGACGLGPPPLCGELVSFTPQSHCSPLAKPGRLPFLEAIPPAHLDPSAFWAFTFHLHHQMQYFWKLWRFITLLKTGRPSCLLHNCTAFSSLDV